MKIQFVKKSANAKTGPIPVSYSERETCPQSCPHYRSDCYAEDYYTRMVWDKVGARGLDIGEFCANVAALPAGPVTDAVFVALLALGVGLSVLGYRRGGGA